MNLPFVSRSIYEDAIAQRDDAQAQVKHLTNIIIDMKVTGATVRQATNGSIGLKLEKKPEDPIETALMENPRTRANSTLRTGWRQWADKQIAAGTDVEDIVERLLTWNRVPNELPDEDDDEEVVA